MSADGHLLQELGERECRTLLGTAVVGRLAFTERALPMILPVHFTVRGDEIVFSSLAGGTIAAAARGAVVAFEADDYDPLTRSGWSVSIVGPSRVITERDAIEALDALDFAPWTGHPQREYFAIQMALLRGRRIHRAPAAGSANGVTALGAGARRAHGRVEG